ncbi:hypothetical protein RND81_13G039100 [Saponaria officinalis]|uniref:Uncharacterized protein n=1 Tax=Saponaria officinalis TaxID=3572 RepID=A0AAW1GZA1_SAPOF
MAPKIHPHQLSSNNSINSSQEREKYTIWMKSLVFSSNGCTIYDSNGNLAYRIDNYDTKCSSQVFLMDLKGNILCTLLRKKLRLREQWNGYTCDKVKKVKPWFQVKKKNIFLNKENGFSCQVTIGGDKSQATSCFKIQGCSRKSEFKIFRGDGALAAELKRKQSIGGVMLGNDVLSLEMVANMDHSFIISLVVVHGLMLHKI